MTLELQDGSAYQGFSFGAEKSVSGELVFQTGNWTLRHCRIISQDPRGGISVDRFSNVDCHSHRNGGISRIDN